MGCALCHQRCKPLYELDHQAAGFAWIDHQDADHSTVSFRRLDSSGDVVYVVSNFTPVARTQFRLPVQVAGAYEVILNSDSAYYWGSNYPVGPHLHAADDLQLALELPPLSTLYLRRCR